MDNTIIQQGVFTSTGEAQNIVLRSDIDWMEIINITEATAATADHGVRYIWRREMLGLATNPLVEYHPAADQTLAIDETAANSFTLVDSSSQTPSAAVILNGAFVTDATQPVIATGDTTGVVEGSIVRLSGTTTAISMSGFDFEVDTIVGNTSFTMRYAMANAPGAAATAGYYRLIPYDPVFYPAWRYAVNITAVVNAVITTSVSHGFTVGQSIRVNVADAHFGMVEINGLEGTVTAVTAGTITTDIDASAFTAFTFALPADSPFTMPTVVPVGMDTSAALTGAVDILADATRDTSYLGMRLAAGVLMPAGSTDDVILWKAGKSFNK